MVALKSAENTDSETFKLTQSSFQRGNQISQSSFDNMIHFLAVLLSPVLDGFE